MCMLRARQNIEYSLFVCRIHKEALGMQNMMEKHKASRWTLLLFIVWNFAEQVTELYVLCPVLIYRVLYLHQSRREH